LFYHFAELGVVALECVAVIVFYGVKMTQLRLTKQQNELWYAYQLNPKGDNYNVAVSYQAEGNLDREKFKLIYQTIGNYFEAFRTQFVETDGEAGQIILDDFHGEFIEQVLNNTTTEQVLKTLEELRAKPFNLEKDCLFRAALITADDQTHYFQFVWHHIVTDGLTTGIFSRVFEKLYNEGLDAIQQFKTYPLAGYLQYEENIIAEKKQETINYWQTYLQGAQQNDLAKYTDDATGKVERQRIDIDPKALSRFLKAHKTTPFIFFNALISTFVYRCFHLTDIMLSYPKNIRPSEFSKIVGYFVSMFPLRVKLSADMTFTQLLDHTRDQYQSSKTYQSIPFEHLKSSLEVDFMPNASIVATHLVSPDMQLSDVKSESNCFFYGGTVEKLSLVYDKVKMIYEIAYNTNYIPSYFIEYFKSLIDEVLTDANKKLSAYELMSSDQKKKILYDWNDTDKSYPRDKTIHQLFEEQVAKILDHVALVFEGNQLTYRELNAQANQLARHLRSLIDIKPDSFIALCLDKSLEMIIGILGILKSGAAYVPIDPGYPDERIKYILEDTKATCLLTQSHYISKLQMLTNTQLIALNDNCYQDLSTDNLLPQSTSNDLAYVIYTSGTTGQPKGVCILHKSLCNMAFSQQENLSINETSRILQFSSIGFDASVWEIFSALVCGATLYIVSNKIKSDVEKLEQVICDQRINMAAFTPEILRLVNPFNLGCLKYVISAGDKCNRKIIDKWKSDRLFINSYGPTENTICMTLYKFKNDDLPNNIGKPLNNIKCYILGTYCRVIPIGVIGELHISGAGLARGYLNQAELTAEKFIPNPFATETDKTNGYDRLYKTGDLVRWLPDGNLEYIGRKDTQVKIRGFRIELSEIESALTQINGIKQAVVINRVINDEQYLFAYYTAHQQISPELVLEELTQKLPHYMLPAAAVQIDNIPLTLNGKVDINGLPLISFQSSQVYIEPRTEQERIICQAFSSVLLIGKIGIDDDFFKLGGNSIKVIQLAIILQANFDIQVSELFDLRTPQKLAENREISHDLLIDKLKQIKHNYANYANNPLDKTFLAKKEQYLAEVASMPNISYTTKPIHNVLLTGATGFLGCNLLNQLLISTPYRIYLCIRAKDKQHALERMAHKYQFYFDLSLEDHFGDRVVYIPCDLEKRQIGVSDDQYYQLSQNIDSIIHCAALAKHYGIEQVFYSANVKSTIHLLELCELTNLKDFHYISTYSVMTGITNDSETILTEDDELTIDGEWNSPYTKTKYLGEVNTLKWREKGINSNIYGSVAEYRFSEMMSILCVLRIYCFVICSNFQVVGIPKKS
jgi:surfactin family lipopeptide synthetase A